MSTPAPATARIDLRLDPSVKTLITSAARAAGYKSISDFLIQAALDKVDAMTSRAQLIQLPEAAQRQIVELLNDPNAFNASRAILKRSDKHFLDDDTIQTPPGGNAPDAGR